MKEISFSRLTERFTNKGIAGVCLKALDYKGNTAEESVVIERLAVFEDFMEENGFESFEELKNLVAIHRKATGLYSALNARKYGKTQMLYCELLHLCMCEENWNFIKEYIDKFAEETLGLINNCGCDDLIPAHRVLMNVQGKIKELEKGGENEKES